MKASAFRSRTAVVLAVVCTVSLVGLGLLHVFGPELKPTRSGQADVYSMSGVGHGALHDLLDELDVPTTIHRNPERRPLEGKGVLLVLEPHPHLLETDGYGRPGVAALVGGAHAVLLALPKWQVRVDGRRQPWVTALAPLEDDEVLAPMQALGIEASIVRPRVGTQTGVMRNAFEHAPEHPTQYRQYLRSPDLEPLVADPFGTLLGRWRDGPTTVYVLSDPDLLANHGLHRGSNASMVRAWIDALRDGGPVVFDETLHGFPPRDESLLRELFRFPLVLALLHVLVVVALVLWAGLGRFGDRPPPSSGIEPGSGFLIRHTAWLLRFGRHGGTALTRYIDDVARDVAARFHLPAELSLAQRDERLDALGRSRGTTRPWSELRRHAHAVAHGAGRRDDVAALRAAQALYAWKREILDGPGIDSRAAQKTA